MKSFHFLVVSALISSMLLTIGTSAFSGEQSSTGVVNIPQISSSQLVDRFRQAAAAGNPEAQYALGKFFLGGEMGVAQNTVEAINWYEKSAEQGFIPSEAKLGEIYSQRTDVPHDYRMALKWWSAAANQNFAPAETGMGILCEFGQGTGKNALEAANWYRKSALQGDIAAQVNLGRLYMAGEGVPRNPSESYFWTSLAARSGIQSYISSRDAIAKGLTVQQRGLVDQRLRIWKPAQSPATANYAQGSHIMASQR
jgi:TPR repeat protein